MSHHLHKLTAFRLTVEDRPGALHRIAGELSSHGINLKALWAWGDEEGLGTAMFVPEDPAQVEGCGCAICSQAEAEPILWLEQEDAPGALAEFLAPIAEAQVNIWAAQAIGVGGQFAAVFMFADEATLDAAAEAAGGVCC